MSVESARSAVRTSRGTVAWVLTGVVLYLALLLTATRVGIAPAEAALELAVPVVAALWGARDLLRVPRFGSPALGSGLLLLIAGALDLSGLFTGWPNSAVPVADLFLLVGMFASVWTMAGQ